MSADGELMLTILASYAQEESLSTSENMKWRIQQNFADGKPWNGTILGYRIENGRYVVVPHEADIVRRIFCEYMEGYGFEAIAQRLNADGYTTRRGGNFHHTGVQKILRNYSYTGNLLLQKTFTENHITKKKLSNTGELPMYHATGTHEAIIRMEEFEAVQREMDARATHFTPAKKNSSYPFTGKVECMNCGKHYRRKTRRNHNVWICTTYNTDR